MTESPLSQAQLQAAAEHLAKLRAEIAKAFLGQPQALEETLVGLVAAGHVLIEGLPGLGKTLLARSLAQAIGGQYGRIQFTPDLMPSDVTGHALFDPKTGAFRIRRGPIFCHLLLGDEINRAPAKTQSALLEAMQEQQVTIEGQSLPLDRPFMVLATQNPLEQEGTYPLPQAQLDRFLLQVRIDYPQEAEELDILRQVVAQRPGDQLDLSGVNTVSSPEQIRQLQETAAHLPIDTAVLRYALGIVRATRDWQGLESGAGPRGAIALVRAARAQALLRGDPFLMPDHVKAIAPAVLRHRIQLSADLEIEGSSPEELLADLLDAVPAPRS